MLSFNSKKDAVDRICFLAVWAMLMAVSVYFCTQKMGFHEDEYYTYYSTARTNGFYVSDGQWMHTGRSLWCSRSSGSSMGL